MRTLNTRSGHRLDGATLHTAKSLQSSSSSASMGIEAIFSLRESDEYEFGLMADMAHKLMGPALPTYPELNELIDCAATLLMPGPEGVRVRAHFKAEPLYGPGARKRPTAYAVNVGRVRVILGLVSAGKASVEGGYENAWVSVLAAQIDIFMPRSFHTAAFSRLGRNKDFLGVLKNAFRTHGTRIHCFESPDGFKIGDPAGEYAWDLLSSAAHWDWLNTITRLQMGRVFHLKSGRFPQTGEKLPPGYHKVLGSDGYYRVQPDENSRTIVRRIIELAASDVDDGTAIKELAELGLRSRQRRDESGEFVAVDALLDTTKAMTLIWQHLPTYASGNYTMTLQNAIPGLTQMLELEVWKETPQDLGVFVFDLDFGLPEGGWHDADLIARAMERRCAIRPKRGKRGDHRKPLLGLCFGVRDDREYRLMADDSTYQLRSRQISESDPLGSAFDDLEGDLIGRFGTQTLHSAVASLLRQVAASAPVDLPLDVDTVSEEALAADLDEQASQDEAAADRYRRLAGTQTDTDEASEYMRLAADAGAHARALRAEAHSRRRQITSLRQLDNLRVDARQLLVVAELLERVECAAAPEVCQAVATVIEKLDILAGLNEPLATLRLTIRMRTNNGTFSVGPVDLTILNTAGRSGRLRTGSGARNLQLLRELFTHTDPDMIRKLEGISNRNERRRLIDALQAVLPNPDAARILLDCPIPELQTVIFSSVFEMADLEPLDVPDDLDAAWIAEMRSVYLAASWTWTSGTWASRNFTLQRTVVAWMARHAPTTKGISGTELKRTLCVSDLEYHAMLSEDRTKYRSKRAGALPPLVLAKEYPKQAKLTEGEQRMVRLRECPTCGVIGDAQILRVPELPNGWLCRTCRQTPGLDAVFPDAYLQPWVGSGDGTRRARTDDQVASHMHVGTQLVPFTVPPRAGLPVGSRQPVEALPAKGFMHFDGYTFTRSELRGWAEPQGISIPDAGRVHHKVLASFVEATQSQGAGKSDDQAAPRALRPGGAADSS